MSTIATPRAIVLRAPGTNCDEETAAAWERAGARAETWHVGRLIESPEALARFPDPDHPRRLLLWRRPGAGRILATRLGHVLGDALRRFHDRGGLIAGICNGFQVLVRGGLLPGGSFPGAATLAHNDSADLRPAGSGSCPGPVSHRSSPSPNRSSCPSPTARDSSSWPIPGHPRRSNRPARSSSSTPTSTVDRPGLPGQSERLAACRRGRLRPDGPDLRPDAPPGTVCRSHSSSAVDAAGRQRHFRGGPGPADLPRRGRGPRLNEAQRSGRVIGIEPDVLGRQVAGPEADPVGPSGEDQAEVDVAVGSQLRRK